MDLDCADVMREQYKLPPWIQNRKGKLRSGLKGLQDFEVEIVNIRLTLEGNADIETTGPLVRRGPGFSGRNTDEESSSHMGHVISLLTLPY